jgi:hypothetical protein
MFPAGAPVPGSANREWNDRRVIQAAPDPTQASGARGAVVSDLGQYERESPAPRVDCIDPVPVNELKSFRGNPPLKHTSPRRAPLQDDQDLLSTFAHPIARQ